ncbi:beta,beta-carotene 15,15'-dioxygenase-like [Ylistrum balloti]|uniref:beta,beta-carotene 15,15'-dioxygenase-like n=1 Tax=Ylistrum balloti TaxID=509963 RepID=UPI0029057EC0|nr:beta,beta-carotene 15,15'-dioxygenase-like [Ylistrum balloti]
MERFRAILVLILVGLGLCSAANPPQDDDCPGFDEWFFTNNQTFENHPIEFENPLPKWLRGTLIRNGAGKVEMGNRKFVHYFDGFAKLHSWKFSGNGSAFFSAKFIQSRVYTESIAKNDIAPFLTFEGVDPPFGEIERYESFMLNMDNTVVNVFNYSNNIVAMNDIWKVYEINPSTLDTIGVVDPPRPPSQYSNLGRLNVMSTAHPVAEYGATSTFDILNTFSLIPGTKERLTVVRVTSLSGRELVAEWEIDKTSYMHSFSVTPNYVILLAAPYYVNMNDMLKYASVQGGMAWNAQDNATFYVVEIKTGKVHTLKTENVFVVHHINSFELPDGKIVLDVPAQPNPYAFALYDVAYIHNKTARVNLTAQPVLTRYTLDIKTQDVQRVSFNSGPKAPCATSLEMPVFNENYRHMNYCYVYGQVVNYNGKGFSHIALVKKDVCNSAGDLMYAAPHQYFTEPWFVPAPGGKEEDDGVLMSSAFDGDKKASYLLMLDPKTMTVMNRSYMPTRVPFNFHGRFFDAVY